MPCDCSHLEPTKHEKESIKVRGFLRECGELPFGEEDSCYGNVNHLDDDTQHLCNWCGTHNISNKSLELQIWWRDHQKADVEKVKREEKAFNRSRLRKQALKKLTWDERKALGL